MIYRIDYVLAVLVAGVVCGAIFCHRLAAIEPKQVARVFYILMCARVVLGAVVFAVGIVLDNQRVFGRLGIGISDAGNFLTGVLFGLSVMRRNRLEVLRQPLVYAGLCMTTAFTFITAGFVKAFYIQGMADFFTQSGYPLAFLKLIMTLEVLGGVGLLIPWAVLAAAFALSIDMFGAIYTHVHNGDPMNDSTGAVGMLIRLAMVATVWALQPGSSNPSALLRRRLGSACIAAILALSLAVAGGTFVRRVTKSPTHTPDLSR